LLAQRERGARAARPGEIRIEVASTFNRLTKRKDSPIRYQEVDKAERQQLGQRGRRIENTRGERKKLDARTSVTPRQKPSKSVGPVRVKLPRPLIVSKRVDQLGKGLAPPKRHRVPKADPASKPGAKRPAPKPKQSKGETREKKAESKHDSSNHNPKDTPKKGKKHKPKDKS
jgi:hypothetical protein